MRHVLALTAKELGTYFLNPLAYLVLFAVQILAWLNFWQLLLQLGPRAMVLSGSLNDPMNTYVSASAQFWIIVLFVIPALTMRLLAEEKRSGTIETLLTAPVTESEIILSKWLAGVAMYLMLLAPFAIYLPFLHAQFPFDAGPIAALGIGLTTMGMMFVAIGVFFSALTRNQIVAGIWTFAALFLIVLLTNLAHSVAVDRRSEWADLLLYVAVLNQANEFGSGRLDPRFLALHLSVTAFMLHITVKVLQAQRGR